MTEKEFKRIGAVLKEYDALKQNSMLLKQFLEEADDHSEEGFFILKFRRPYANDMGVLTKEITLSHYDNSVIEKIMQELRIEYGAMCDKMSKLTAYEEDLK